jgi:hypothetical protein
MSTDQTTKEDGEMVEKRSYPIRRSSASHPLYKRGFVIGAKPTIDSSQNGNEPPTSQTSLTQEE